MNERPITEDDINGFVDRRLDARREAEVAAYLESHRDVAQRVAGYREQRDMLRDAFAPIADEPAPAQLDLARMIEARNRRGFASHWAMAAAAAVLLCVGGTSGWLMRSATQAPLTGVAALAQEAADNYTVYAPDDVRPVEIRAADRNELLDWVSQRLGRQVAVPDLTGSGYRFMGGRVVATAHGPAAIFMYGNDRGTRLVMLVRPMDTEQNLPMSPFPRGRLNDYSWADKGLGYSFVGDINPDQLRSMAEQVSQQISSST
jgi:anti-sigma factor RsiW